VRAYSHPVRVSAYRIPSLPVVTPPSLALKSPLEGVLQADAPVSKFRATRPSVVGATTRFWPLLDVLRISGPASSALRDRLHADAPVAH
jgi:hypothetical protein